MIGNYIGLDAGGTLDRGNATYGIGITSGGANTVGGTAAGERNAISGNDQYGVGSLGGGGSESLLNDAHGKTHVQGILIMEVDLPDELSKHINLTVVLPIIAILASLADSPTIVSVAEELRVKESDRINAICYNLAKMGCEVIERKDGFIINPVNSLHHTNIKTFSDHRIAMAFTIAGLLTPERNILDDENCINISFPEFNKMLDMLL